MFIWFKKKIATDTSGEEARRITNILEENDIHYEIRTKRSRGVIGLVIDSRYHARINQPLYKGSRQLSYVYMIYVRRKDYDRAYDLLY
jgi:hypothetical protein